jgi:hypothetical protein
MLTPKIECEKPNRLQLDFAFPFVFQAALLAGYDFERNLDQMWKKEHLALPFLETKSRH